MSLNSIRKGIAELKRLAAKLPVGLGSSGGTGRRVQRGLPFGASCGCLPCNEYGHIRECSNFSECPKLYAIAAKTGYCDELDGSHTLKHVNGCLWQSDPIHCERINQDVRWSLELGAVWVTLYIDFGDDGLLEWSKPSGEFCAMCSNQLTIFCGNIPDEANPSPLACVQAGGDLIPVFCCGPERDGPIRVPDTLQVTVEDISLPRCVTKHPECEGDDGQTFTIAYDSTPKVVGFYLGPILTPTWNGSFTWCGNNLEFDLWCNRWGDPARYRWGAQFTGGSSGCGSVVGGAGGGLECDAENNLFCCEPLNLSFGTGFAVAFYNCCRAADWGDEFDEIGSVEGVFFRITE